MVRTAFGEDTDPQNYILYSGADERQLRFAPVVRAQQMEALQLRNQLLGLEKSFTRLGLPNKEGQSNLLLQSQAFIRQLHPSNHPGARGFIQRDLEQLFQVFDGLPILEKKYLTAFSGFIAREHRLAKVGSEETDGQSGQAALWLSNYQQKDAEFKLLAYLELESNGAEEEEPILTFRKTERTNPLANFRMGDIAVLYPFQEDQSSPLQGQLMKCTLISIDGQRIRIRLRSRQLNTAHFGNFQFWNLEHDLLDSGYNDMYRSLYRFMTFSSDKRDLWLAKKPPRSPKDGELELPADLTTEQQGIFQAILRSEAYFMLWGPPGTGKTSIMLKHLVGYWFDHTDENMVLLAYTNRAVDEIYEAIRSYRPGMQQAFLRIGSKYSTAPAFQDNLLTVKTAHIATRKELKQLIRKYRIVVGTVASVVNKPELFSIKSFDRVIIDEASQILEPLLVGLLPQFKHVTLIGDHKQLPAVVVQSPQLSMVDDTDLQEVGLENLRNSLFERLYKQALKNHWDWSYAQLSYQGRMHRDLMMFPNQVFYEGKLKILPKGIPAFTKQIEGIPAIPERLQDDKWIRLIANQRMVFIATPSDHKSVTRKTNAYEAEHVALIIQAFRQWYSLQDRVISIGVITPYRAQIAQIRTTLEAHNLSTIDITIDTVERYQGGARDVIIFSLCTNSLQQIQSMMSLSDEGVDRKLNVALTRARKHLIILGNEYLLRQQKIYQQLIDHCAHLD
ncbi:MAG: AAA family ATPase [Saprospiraceae bacterium]|nr:AAA family ATPase [Saprospiraceae bacterium]